jgi:hypothetical protein
MTFVRNKTTIAQPGFFSFRHIRLPYLSQQSYNGSKLRSQK